MSAPLRVLHLHSGNLYGGVETMLLTVAALSRRNSMDSRFGLSFDQRFAAELREIGAVVTVVGPAKVSRPWTVWRARRHLGKLLRTEPPDVTVVHSGWSQSVFGPVVQTSRIPMIRWLHASPDPKNWLERLARWTPPSWFICNSHYTENGLLGADPDAPHSVILPPVPHPAPEVAQSRRRIRTELGVPDGTTVILQVGRLEPGKGHQVLLDALAQLKSRNDWVAWEVGGAQRESEVAYLGALGLSASRLGIAGRVKFLGERRDVRELIAAADIYCQPNRTPESFGITFIEALYAGVPVVTSSIGGAVEIVDQSCGVLVPPGDASALAGALGALLDQPAHRRALGAAGPGRAESLCAPEVRVAETRIALGTVAGK